MDEMTEKHEQFLERMVYNHTLKRPSWGRIGKEITPIMQDFIDMGMISCEKEKCVGNSTYLGLPKEKMFLFRTVLTDKGILFCKLRGMFDD